MEAAVPYSIPAPPVRQDRQAFPGVLHSAPFRAGSMLVRDGYRIWSGYRSSGWFWRTEVQAASLCPLNGRQTQRNGYYLVAPAERLEKTHFLSMSARLGQEWRSPSSRLPLRHLEKLTFYQCQPLFSQAWRS